MDLVLLPHHNTVTSLQKLQQEAVCAVRDMQDMLFLPAYPLVCVLAHVDEDEAASDLQKRMQLLNATLKDKQGAVLFSAPRLSSHPAAKAGDCQKSLIVPVQVPFSDALKEAGFVPVNTPHIVLGCWCAAREDVAFKADDSFKAEPPAPSRAFRLALMKTTPLSAGTVLPQTEQKSSFTWKYHDAFWLKLN